MIDIIIGIGKVIATVVVTFALVFAGCVIAM